MVGGSRPRPGRRRGVRCSPRRFHQLVTRACDRLPLHVQRQLRNIAFTVEDEPSEEVERDGGALGLYQGIPIGERGTSYTLTLPDKVTIYRLPLLRACHSQHDLAEQVELTLLHEIGHYFGMSDDELPF